MPTISNIVTAYLADQRNELPARSFAQRERYASLFAEAFGSRDHDTLRPSEVKAWITSHDGWNQNTRSTVATIVKRIFNWAMNDRLIESSPIRGMHIGTGQPRRATTEDEFQAMLRVERGPLRWLLIFMRSTGCRPGEAACLRWEWIDWTLQVAVLPPTAHKTGKKTGKPRLIPLPGTAIKLLRWLEQRKTTDLVFVNSAGSRWNGQSMHARMVVIREKAGLDAGATFHGIRHLFACSGLAASSDLKAISRVIGHDRVQTTEQHYLHVGAEEIAGMVRVAELAAKRGKHG